MKSCCWPEDELTFQIDGDKIVIRNIFQEQRDRTHEHLCCRDLTPSSPPIAQTTRHQDDPWVVSDVVHRVLQTLLGHRSGYESWRLPFKTERKAFKNHPCTKWAQETWELCRLSNFCGLLTSSTSLLQNGLNKSVFETRNSSIGRQVTPSLSSTMSISLHASGMLKKWWDHWWCGGVSSISKYQDLGL